MILIAFAIALVVSSVIINAVQNMIMKFLGVDVMFFSAKTKLIMIIVLALLLLAPFNAFFD